MVKTTDKKDKKDKISKRQPKSDEEEVREDEKNIESAQEEIPVKADKPKKEKTTIASTVWQPRQLFISGIPYDTTKDQLLEFFSDERAAITEVKLPTFQDSGRCVGYAHVMFTNKEAYAAALAKQG